MRKRAFSLVIKQIGNSAYHVVLFGLLAAALFRSPWSNTRASDVPKPALVNTCLITGKFAQLVDFYQRVLEVSPQRAASGGYAEFHTGTGVVAIFSADEQEKYIPGSAEPANNRSAIMEFRVENVDTEYSRLESFVRTWVKPPTNQPWGTRSFYFRDPDGNLVDFYSPLKAQ